MDIGIRELKSKLSEYVARAAGGEIIRVTDRGVPKAMLTPLGGESRIEQGIREGWISVSPNYTGKVKLPTPGLWNTDKTTEQLIQEERDA
ncbi:MAG: type II toxin-antitoxin system prevent-host-death family antitoxin [Thermoleophilia bacterium]|nr:type II toxin-antitoxin system prevent-host-death family antitoxin [Thermoleophilia bacterium]